MDASSLSSHLPLIARLVNCRAAAILVCNSERDLGRVSKLSRGAEWGLVEWGRGNEKIGSLDTLQIALAFTNQDGGSSIEAYQSRESHGKIGGL